jgi:hypothetical protein
MDDCRRPNFGDNSKWFDIKILTDGTREDTKKEIQPRTYTDPIRKVFKKLLIVAAHFGHWGRVNGPVELEFEEVSPEYIRILGELVGRFWLIVVSLLFHCLTFLLSLFSQVIGTLRHRKLAIRPRCQRQLCESSLAMSKASVILSLVVV